MKVRVNVTSTLAGGWGDVKLTYHCSKCDTMMDERIGCLIHPSTKLGLFKDKPIDCPHIGKKVEHPFVFEVKEI